MNGDMDPTVVVTGVSSGIGLATACLLAGRGIHVFGSVRRLEDASGLMAELGARFTPLLLDVTDGGAVRQAAAGPPAAPPRRPVHRPGARPATPQRGRRGDAGGLSRRRWVSPPAPGVPPRPECQRWRVVDPASG
jgi:nucleoside-diphosphate-sugar epimerase